MLRTCSLLRLSKAVSLSRAACAYFHQGPRSTRSHHQGRIYGRNLLCRNAFSVLHPEDGSIYGGCEKNILFFTPREIPSQSRLLVIGLVLHE
jgi:hypothetical protein